MSIKDTSGHKVMHGESMANGIKQGDDTSHNPAHGAAMDNVRHSIKHGSPEGKYYPNTRDMDSRDDHCAHGEGDDETFL